MRLHQLSEPFDPLKVSWRVGSTTKDKSKGMALAYIDARDVMERLDTVCGPECWQVKYPHAGAKTVCEIGIKIGEEWVWKSNGAGDTDFEGDKGAMSDSFKRAAVLWGIGRYLYDIQSMWVEIEQKGRSYAIRKPEISKLQKLLGVKSSHQLKKELNWDDLQVELENDLLDAKSKPALTQVYNTWVERKNQDGWNHSFRGPIKERFAEYGRELEAA